MLLRKSDIRLLNTNDVPATANTIRDYLAETNFKIDQWKISSAKADIQASNNEQSVIKLFLLNAPQIIIFRINKKNDQIHIETSCDLFAKFRQEFKEPPAHFAATT